ncbi:MAG: hypothetical protein FWB95_00475 [Treponema sp.]|nr:hypothetical protein [Treponema sp.]
MKSNYIYLITAFCIAFCSCTTVPKTTGVKDNFTIDLNARPIQIGEIELQIETFFGLGKLKKIIAPVTYYPKEDAVCLQYKFNMINCQQFWSRKGRLVFQSSLDRYNEDYDMRNLSRNDRKSQERYGETIGYLIWQQADFLVRARGNMRIHLGYTFKDKAPFFTVFQLDAEYIDEMARDNNRVSDIVTFFYTRAQAADLVSLFNQDMLDEYATGAKEPPAWNNRVDADRY